MICEWTAYNLATRGLSLVFQRLQTSTALAPCRLDFDTPFFSITALTPQSPIPSVPIRRYHPSLLYIAFFLPTLLPPPLFQLLLYNLCLQYAHTYHTLYPAVQSLLPATSCKSHSCFLQPPTAGDDDFLSFSTGTFFHQYFRSVIEDDPALYDLWRHRCYDTAYLSVSWLQLLCHNLGEEWQPSKYDLQPMMPRHTLGLGHVFQGVWWR